MNRVLLYALACALAAAPLAACSGAPGPESVVEMYLQAVLANDEVRAVNLSCANWEAQARAEGRSFEGVAASLEGLSCAADEIDGQTTQVNCVGRIVYSYGGGENKKVDLASRSFTVVLEGELWRMCGYE